jgi:hypothetical protein
VTVNYSTTDGTATAGTDFVAATGTLIWVDGDTDDKLIRIVSRPDSAAEGNEELTIRLSGPTGGATIPQSGRTQVVRILDNDSIGFASTQVTAREASGSVLMNVSRRGTPDGAVSVNYATSSGSATAGSDFTSESGTLSWADGDATDKTITVKITNDSSDEDDETFTVRLSGLAAGGTRSVLRVTITDDDVDHGSLGFAAIAAGIGEGGSHDLAVVRTGSSVGAVSVDYTTVSGTAIAGADFTSASGTLSWADGDSTRKTITVDTTQDTMVEGDEAFTVTLSNPTAGATLGSNSTIPVTIRDNDAPPLPPGSSLGLERTAPTIGEASGSIFLTVWRSGSPIGAVSVDYATAPGTADAGADYISASGTLHWADGDFATKTIAVSILNDTTLEGSEIFTVALSNPSAGAIVAGVASTASVTITDDDSPAPPPASAPPPAAPPPPDGPSDSDGGGGALDWLIAFLLAGLNLHRRKSRKTFGVDGRQQARRPSGETRSQALLPCQETR